MLAYVCHNCTFSIKFDSFMSSEGHVRSLCKKSSQKLHVLARVVIYMDLRKKKALMKVFMTF